MDAGSFSGWMAEGLDEVAEAKRKRWVRQLGEAMGEVFRSEIPVTERLEAIDLFTRVMTASALPAEFQPHEDSPMAEGE